MTASRAQALAHLALLLAALSCILYLASAVAQELPAREEGAATNAEANPTPAGIMKEAAAVERSGGNASIIIFKDASGLDVMRQACSGLLQPRQPAGSSSSSSGDADDSRSSDNDPAAAACNFQGCCLHLYSAWLCGVAGRFSPQQLAQLEACLPQGAIAYVEPDGPVSKAEEASGAYAQWWTWADADSGEAAAAAGPDDSGSTAAQPVPAADSAGSAATQPVAPYTAAGSSEEIPAKAFDLLSVGAVNDGMAQHAVAACGSGGGCNSTAPAIGGREQLSRVLSVREQLHRWLLARIGLDAQQHLISNASLPLRLLTRGRQGPDSAGGAAHDQPAGSASTGNGELNARISSSSGGGDGGGRSAGASGTSSNRSAVGRVPQVWVELLDGEEAVSAATQPGMKAQQLHPALWSLDRLDQRDLPLDHLYRFGSEGSPGTGKGVTIYVLDSGLYTQHQEFRQVIRMADGGGGLEGCW